MVRPKRVWCKHMTDENQRPELIRIDAGGVELAAFEWRRDLRGKAPTFVFAHATGFHARCWDQVIVRLGARHVIALDQRGHGRSAKVVFDTWVRFGEDLRLVLEGIDITGAIGVGHSMGGHATVAAAALNPRLFQRLILIDPVIMAPHYYEDSSLNPWQGAAVSHPASRRRRYFATVEAMKERLGGREPFSSFVPEALDDYCRYGLLPATDGQGWELACPPEFEASIYETSMGNAAIYDDVRAIEVPVTLIRAKAPREPSDILDFSFSPTWPDLAGEFRNATDHYLPRHTHFAPMQDPALIAQLISG